ncbi:Zinc finger, CCHC-type superfamily [Sesbania bispinosa]|nr:Zinc finger, CCHC-type superfamily [Sesbania bispinosa]
MASELHNPRPEHEVKDSKKKSHASGIMKDSAIITPLSPYYLGSSDNPGIPLVAAALTSDNYRNWERSMKTALRAKTKLGFINGSITKPALTSTNYQKWEKVDSMVTAWIINSTDPTLHGSISHATTVREVWLDLEERFAQANAPRIHQLWRNLCLMRQEPDMSVTEFYTKFKSLWDELSELQPYPECTCGTILNTDPLPSLRRTFNHILRDEARVTTERGRDTRHEAGREFYAPNSRKQRGRDGPKMKCEHCGKIGHEKSRCFELVGYPSNWDFKWSQRDHSKVVSNQRGAHMVHMDNNQRDVEKVVSGHASHMKRDADQHDSMSGNNMINKEASWVLDSGASHHMTPLYHFFEEVYTLDKPFHITVPTGNTVQTMRKTIGFSDLHDGVYVLRKTGQRSSLAAIQGDTGHTLACQNGTPIISNIGEAL